MSDYKHKPNNGSAFKNNKKEKDTHADFQGTALIACPHCNKETTYWFNMWQKVKEGSNNWFSFSVKAKTFSPAPQNPTPQQAQHSVAKGNAFVDDSEIPF